jgi:phasin
MAKKATKATKATKRKKKVAGAKETTKKSAAKKSAKRTAVKRAAAKKAPARKAKAAKSPERRPAAKKPIAPVAAAAPAKPAAPPAPKPVAPPKPFVPPPRPAAPAPAPMAPPTETTIAATRPNTAKHTASPFGLPKDEIPKFDLLKMEVPAAFRELADKDVAQAKKNYERMIQTIGNEMTAILEKAFSNAKGVADYNLKLFEMARAHTCAVLDFARKLVTSKSLSEVIEFSTAHARDQFDTVSAQNKELLALTQKVAIETAESVQRAGS